MSYASIRRDYVGQPLVEDRADVDPLRQFEAWFEEVRPVERDATAMSLATATAHGSPSVRMVLLKGLDARGFTFYTNHESRKARELAETARAALLFYWAAFERQVRIEGLVEKVSGEDADAYFASRPLDSRWSVYASHQSQVVENREVLEARMEEARLLYGDDVPRPAWWGGYRVVPEVMEFWQGRPGRLHDRLRYTRDGRRWVRERLAP
jgi:pyridoxamine 5'-phosphate oxidase